MHSEIGDQLHSIRPSSDPRNCGFEPVPSINRRSPGCIGNPRDAGYNRKSSINYTPPGGTGDGPRRPHKALGRIGGGSGRGSPPAFGSGPIANNRLPSSNFRVAGDSGATLAKQNSVGVFREFVSGITSRAQRRAAPQLRVDTLTLFCDPFRMKKLSVYMALVMALVSSLVATDATASLNAARLHGVAFDVIPVCRMPVGVTSYYDQKDVPVALRDAIRQNLGELVPPNSPFDSTDVATTGHNRRLIFIWARGHRWVVASERGGRGYSDPIFAFEVSANGRQAALIAERTANPNSVCSMAEELLNLRAPTAL